MIDIIHTKLIKHKYNCTKYEYRLYTDYTNMDRLKYSETTRLDFVFSDSNYLFETVCLCKNTLVRVL